MGSRSIAMIVLVLSLLTFSAAQDLPPTDYFDMILDYFRELNTMRTNISYTADVIDEMNKERTAYPGVADKAGLMCFDSLKDIKARKMSGKGQCNRVGRFRNGVGLLQFAKGALEAGITCEGGDCSTT